MARVQLVIPDSDRDRYVYQAQREGMTFSAWLRAAAEERLAKQQQVKLFESVDDLEAFFRQCDEREGDTPEPDWHEHLIAMEESRMSSLPTT